MEVTIMKDVNPIHGQNRSPHAESETYESDLPRRQSTRRTDTLIYGFMALVFIM